MYTWGTLCFAYVAKEYRTSKLQGRARIIRMGIWAGTDSDISNCDRVIPIDWDSKSEQWTLGPTVITDHVKVFEGVFPLRMRMIAQGQLEKQVADFSKGEAALLNSAD